jgi:hypothetical protein
VLIALVPPLSASGPPNSTDATAAERAWVIAAVSAGCDLLALHAVEVTSVLANALDDEDDGDGKRSSAAASAAASSATALLPSFELFTANSLLEAHRADPHSVAYNAIGGPRGAGQDMTVNGMTVEPGLAGSLFVTVTSAPRLMRIANIRERLAAGVAVAQ